MSWKALLSSLLVVLTGQTHARNCLIWLTAVLMQLAATVMSMQEA